MISLDRLVCRAYSAQALKKRSVKIHLFTARNPDLPSTPATGVRLRITGMSCPLDLLERVIVQSFD
jgi:hypothetical protein